MFLRDNCPLINLVRLAFSILNSIENYKKNRMLKWESYRKRGHLFWKAYRLLVTMFDL